MNVPYPLDITEQEYRAISAQQYPEYFKQCFEAKILLFTDPLTRDEVHYQLRIYFKNILSSKFFEAPPRKLWKTIDPRFALRYPNGRIEIEVANNINNKFKEQVNFEEFLDIIVSDVQELRARKQNDGNIFLPRLPLDDDRFRGEKPYRFIMDKLFEQEHLFYNMIKTDAESYKQFMGKFSLLYNWIIPKIQILENVSQYWKDVNNNTINGTESNRFWRRIYFLVVEYMINKSLPEEERYLTNIGDNQIRSTPIEIYTCYVDDELFYYTKNNKTRLPLNYLNRDYLLYNGTDVELAHGIKVNNAPEGCAVTIANQNWNMYKVKIYPFDFAFRTFMENKIYDEIFMKGHVPTEEEFIDLFPLEFQEYETYRYGLQMAYKYWYYPLFFNPATNIGIYSKIFKLIITEVQNFEESRKHRRYIGDYNIGSLLATLGYRQNTRKGQVKMLLKFFQDIDNCPILIGIDHENDYLIDKIDELIDSRNKSRYFSTELVYDDEMNERNEDLAEQGYDVDDEGRNRGIPEGTVFPTPAKLRKFYINRHHNDLGHLGPFPPDELPPEEYKVFNLIVGRINIARPVDEQLTEDEGLVQVYAEMATEGRIKQYTVNDLDARLGTHLVVYYHFTPSVRMQDQFLLRNELFNLNEEDIDYLHTFRRFRGTDPIEIIKDFIRGKGITNTTEATTQLYLPDRHAATEYYYLRDLFKKATKDEMYLHRGPLEENMVYPSRFSGTRHWDWFIGRRNFEGYWFVEIHYLILLNDEEHDDHVARKSQITFTLERFLNTESIDLSLDDLNQFWDEYKERKINYIPPSSLITDIVLYKKEAGLRRLKIGFFFPYVFKKELEKFRGIFKLLQCYGEEDKDDKETPEDCFLWAMDNQVDGPGITIEEKNYIKSKTKTIGVSFKDIKEIAERMQCTIEVTKHKFATEGERVEKKVFGTNRTRVFKIGYISNERISIPHYFPMFDLPYYKAALQNLLQLIQEHPTDDWKQLLQYERRNCGNGHIIWRYKPIENCTTSSFSFLNACIKNELVIPMGMRQEMNLFKSIRRKHYDYVLNLEIEAEQKQFELKDKENKDTDTSTIYFADCESITTSAIHKAYCICYSNYAGDDEGYFYGLDCLEQFLAFMFTRKGNPIVYFHNLKYDGTLFMPIVYMTEMIKKNGKIYEMKLVKDENAFDNVKKYQKNTAKIVTFKDSLCIISMPLRSFNRAFNLGANEEKEIFPYCAVDEDHLQWCTIENCWRKETPQWDNDKINQFKNNLQRLNYIENNQWNVEKYTYYYCMRDVQILRDGVKKFAQMTKEMLDIDMFKCLTASGLAQKYMEREVYGEISCFCMNGMLANFCRKACYGGRCMTRKNEKWITEGDMCDYDACSLYPSAMHRLKLPTGEAYPMMRKPVSWFLENLQEEQDIEGRKPISYFIAKIKIKRVTKHLEFPLICIKSDEGINEYIDIQPGSHQRDLFYTEIYVDSIYLEDLIKYQGIEYEECRDRFGNTIGVYWKGPKSDLLSKTIEKLYNQRLELKRQKNPAQEVLKLIMNSSYGKCIQKPIDCSTNFYCRRADVDIHMCNYYNKIKQMEEINPHCFKIDEFKNDDNYNMTHFGAMILSMSKRIMNEVFFAGKEAGCRIYYQDTDSIHIPKTDLTKLEEKFKELYGRDLAGKNMGQFHVDFNPVNGDDNVISKKTIICGKKCYLDKLQNSRGEFAYHVRMKGISENCVRGTAENYGGLEQLYEKLYYHPLEKIHFDLAKYNPQFKINCNTVVSLQNFPRELAFTSKANQLETI